MILFKDTYATVWSVEDKGNYVQGRISTSEKDTRNEGKYINSNWFCRFVGKCKDESARLPERSRIKILSGKIATSTVGEGDNKKTYTNVVIFDYVDIKSNCTTDRTLGNNTFQVEPEAKGFTKPVETQRVIDGNEGFYPIDSDTLPF